MKKINVKTISIIVIIVLGLTSFVYGVQAAIDTNTKIGVEDEMLNKEYGLDNQEEVASQEESNDQSDVILEDVLDIKSTNNTYDEFLKLDGIQGESSDMKHKNEIDIYSYVFGGRNSVVDENGQNLHLNVIKLTKHIDKSSPKLFQAMLNGDVISNGTLSLVKQGGRTPVTFSTIVLKDVRITSFKQYGEFEEICLGYSKISFTYTPQNSSGTAGEPVVASWNLLTNSKD